MILLHYTGMKSAESALDWLTRTESRVSAHYLVDEAGRITQMVRETERAWHAGRSHWAGETDINSCSVGIEIHNPGHELGYPDFPEPQMAAVEALCLDIAARCDVQRQRVLAHSDVAPARKADPGEKFDWARLARAGLGLWVEPEPLGDDTGLAPGDTGPRVTALHEYLRDFGYSVEVTDNYDLATELAVRAFQRHFRPARVDGRADQSVLRTLERLLEKSRSHPIAV
ncbi:MAG: N-acetylmuramoyl-L-alanine amidase [Methyloligellaceae bacterium]